MSDMRKLLESMAKFAGEPEQRPGDQVRGTEPAKKKKSGKHPFQGRLVGGGTESIIRDLERQLVEGEIERRLREEFEQFAEFAPPGGDDREPDNEDILRKLAAQWWHGDEDSRAERALAAMGWEIGQDESGDDDAGVFVVRAGDVNGDSYMAFPQSELNLDESLFGFGTKPETKNKDKPVDPFAAKLLARRQQQQAQAPKEKIYRGPEEYRKEHEKDIDEDQLDEKWSQKYKRSINCSHPRGFSQRAHCQGRKKHTESVEMESVCPDCGMCETHGDNLVEITQRLDAHCWKNKHKEGTKIKGGVRVNNCVPNESMEEPMDEKSVSQAQFRTMAAAAHNPEFAKKVGIKPAVAKEFHRADKKQSYKKLPKKISEFGANNPPQANSAVTGTTPTATPTAQPGQAQPIDPKNAAALKQSLMKLKTSVPGLDVAKATTTMAKADTGTQLNPLDQKVASAIAPQLANVMKNPQMATSLKMMIDKANQQEKAAAAKPPGTV